MDDFETAKQCFVAGLKFLGANDFQSAEGRFARSLELIPDRVSTLNNLAAIKNRLKKFTEAEALALKAIAVDDQSPEAWSNLGFALARTKRHEEALTAYERALHCDSTYVSARLYQAMTLLDLKRFEEALQVCDEALKLNPGQYEILYTKSLVLRGLKQTDEAQKIYVKSLEIRVDAAPAFIAERRASQKADVLIINRNPQIDSALESFESLQLQCSNFPGQIAKALCDDFHFTFAFEGTVVRPSAREKISRPDFVLNNMTNGELVLSKGSLTEFIEAVDSFGVPVINHPTKVVQTTRDTSAKLLDDISGVRVPKTRRFSAIGKTAEELAHEIEDQYNYPLITRTLFSQHGKGMSKVDSRDALIEVLDSDFPENFFVTEFVDSRGKNEFYRKLRAAIVKDEIIIVRADYDTFWNIHGRKDPARVPFYLENSQLLEEEKQICANPERNLGRSAVQALRAIRERIPLDIFGIDFDVDADEQVIFYEANATMNLLSTAQKQVPNPQEAEDRLKLAFHRYFTSLAGRN